MGFEHAHGSRERLFQMIASQGMPDGSGPLPVVSLEDFFDGNEDLGSIGCNLLDHPGILVFYRTLADLRADERVQDILVEISEADAEHMDWPFSDSVYVIASLTAGEIAERLAALQPDDVGDYDRSFAYGTPVAAPPIAPGMRVFRVWWD